MMQRPRHRCEGTAMGAIVVDLRPRLDIRPFALGMPICQEFAQIEQQPNIYNVVHVKYFDETSAVVGAGRQRLKYKRLINSSFADLKKPQVELDVNTCESVGQNRLMALYDTLFSQVGSPNLGPQWLQELMTE